MRGGRWLVVLGALLIAGVALYVLATGEPRVSSPTATTPIMDEIDADSRAEMRKLLRDSGED
jgi:hypothetical protein